MALVGVTVLFAFLLAWWFYQGHVNDQALLTALAKTDALEPDGWRLEDIERQRLPIADEDNSGLFLQSCKKLRPKRWPYWDGWSPTDEDEEHTREAFDHLLKIGELPPNMRLSYRQYSALRNEICRAQPYLAEVRKVSEMPWGRYPIKYAPDGISTLLPFTQDARDFANSLGWDALLRTEEGDLPGALEDCRGMLNAGRSVGDEPFLISVLVRIALRSLMLQRLERILAHGQGGEDDLLKLQQFLEREENEQILHRSARGERASLDRMMAALQSGQITYAQMRNMMAQGSSAKLYGLEDWAFWATAGPPEVNRARFLELNNRFVEISQWPAEEILPALTALTEHVKTNEPKFVRGLFLPVERVGGAYVKVTAQTRAARVMLAAERFRLQRGRWPETLDELVPEFLERVPIDPFDGKPLRWMRKPDGWAVYSVSKDGVDNEGNLSDRYMNPGVDLGYWLYDVDQRRIPNEE